MSRSEGMILSETLQVVAIIEKLPSGWKNFKNYLKHKRKEMKLGKLILRLHIEEDNRGFECKSSNSITAKENLVEHKQGQSSNDMKTKNLRLA